MEAHETGALNSSHGENSHDDLIYSYLKGTREEDKLTYQAANYLFSLCQKHLVEHSREKKKVIEKLPAVMLLFQWPFLFLYSPKWLVIL